MDFEKTPMVPIRLAADGAHNTLVLPGLAKLMGETIEQLARTNLSAENKGHALARMLQINHYLVLPSDLTDGMELEKIGPQHGGRVYDSRRDLRPILYRTFIRGWFAQVAKVRSDIHMIQPPGIIHDLNILNTRG